MAIVEVKMKYLFEHLKNTTEDNKERLPSTESFIHFLGSPFGLEFFTYKCNSLHKQNPLSQKTICFCYRLRLTMARCPDDYSCTLCTGNSSSRKYSSTRSYLITLFVHYTSFYSRVKTPSVLRNLFFCAEEIVFFFLNNA